MTTAWIANKVALDEMMMAIFNARCSGIRWDERDRDLYEPAAVVALQSLGYEVEGHPRQVGVLQHTYAGKSPDGSSRITLELSYPADWTDAALVTWLICHGMGYGPSKKTEFNEKAAELQLDATAISGQVPADNEPFTMRIRITREEYEQLVRGLSITSELRVKLGAGLELGMAERAGKITL